MMFDNVHFKNPEGDCIYIARSYGGQASTVVPYDVQVSNCRFTGNSINRNAISVITGFQIRITGNHFYKITKSDMPGPIDLEPNSATEFIKNVVISNNTFNQCHGGISTYRVATGPTDYENISNVSITGNVFNEQTSGNLQSYIAIYNAKNITVANNCLYDAVDIGIAISESYGVICNNNTILNPNLGGFFVLDVHELKIDNNYIEINNDTYGANVCYGIDVNTAATLLADNYSMVGGSISNNTILSTASSPTNNTGIALQGNVTDVALNGIVKGFYTGLAIGYRAGANATDLKVNLDITQNTVPLVKSVWGSGNPSSIGQFSLGRDITYGKATFSASATKTIASLPVLTTSVMTISRIGATGLANTLTIDCLVDGTITATSSASESGSFIWEIIDL